MIVRPCLLLIALVLAGALLASCDAAFDPASYIERTRVVGARTTVDAEPARAWVVPGESVTVTWLTVSPENPVTLSWAFALCVGGEQGCVAEPLEVLTGQGPTPVVTFTAPDAAALGTSLSPILMGVICANGTIAVDPATSLPSCTGDGADGTNVVFVVPVQRGGETNHHPDLSDNHVQIGDMDWTATPSAAFPVGTACDATVGLPVVGASKQKFRFISDANNRESYLPEPSAALTLEELQISQLTTAGKFTYAYSAVAATDLRPDADVRIEWQPPAATEIPAAGMVVEMHFVVRDLRGGIDVIHRALCLTAS